ncbi:type 4b pilus protein PilO2 [Gulbenkiania mobilis]|uniref:type 4b pilus protein PilO2 n=1 Tax=Gulbenkiania mobilis TaxID=397457 RepID=UPI0006BC0994|nr:type 4b pilus protein PilO2 [Gulbenkiania mobilis]
MDSQIYQYGKRCVAVGSTWHAPAAASKSAFAKTVAAALRENTKLPLETRSTHHTAEYVSAAGHAEIGFFRMPKKQACPPLVKVIQAALGETAGQSWAALIQLDEQTWWFAGVIENVVQPETDVYGSFDYVWSLWNDRAMLFDADSHIFVNVERSDFKGTSLIQLDELVESIDERTWKKLVPQANASVVNPRTAIATVLILAIAGWMGWDEYNRHVQEQEMAARLATQQSAMEANKQTMPWHEQPTPSTFIYACNAALEKVTLTNAGWTFTGAACTDGGVTAEFDRNTDWPEAGDIIDQNPSVELTPGGKKASVRSVLNKPSVSKEGTPTAAQQLIRLVHTTLPVWVDSANITPENSLNAGQFKGMKIVLASKMPAEDFARYLDAIPTFRITTIHYKPDLTADIEGISYAN